MGRESHPIHSKSFFTLSNKIELFECMWSLGLCNAISMCSCASGQEFIVDNTMCLYITSLLLIIWLLPLINNETKLIIIELG